MTDSCDLDSSRPAEDLIDALFAARRERRVDLAAAVELLLGHDSEVVRSEAVSLLLTKWRLPALRPQALTMIKDDPDAGVRARVALGLAAISNGFSRSDDAQTLAEVALGDGREAIERSAAVEGLARLAGRPAAIVSPASISRALCATLIREIEARID